MSSILNDNCDDFNFDDSGESESNNLAQNQETNGSGYHSLPLLMLIIKELIQENMG